MSALELRAAGLFETELLGELHARCFAAPWDESWSAASFAEILRHAGITALIAVSGGEPVGFGLTLKAADEVELLLLAVLPAHRGQGIASSLLEALMEKARANGAARAFLEVAEENAAAIACYRRAGFAPVGRRKNYYRGSIDALLFSKSLNTP